MPPKTRAETPKTPEIGPCRWCRRPSWLADDEKRPAHPCCTYWMGGKPHLHPRCLACDASEAYARGKKA